MMETTGYHPDLRLDVAMTVSGFIPLSVLALAIRVEVYMTLRASEVLSEVMRVCVLPYTFCDIAEVAEPDRILSCSEK